MATEKRLIDAHALIDEIDGIYKRHYANSTYQFIHDFFRAMFRRIHKAPTVDAVEVVHGRWIKEYEELGIDRGWKCSCCKGSVYHMTYEMYEYCPHCGAYLMDGDGNA